MLATIPPPPTNGVQLGPLDLRFYGVLIAIGAYLALRWAVKRYAERGGDPDLAERTALLGIGVAFLGARLGYVLPRLDYFLANPQDILAIWQGGLAFFGGVTLGVPVCWWYVRRSGGDVAAMADSMAPAVPLAQAIGRWGNYFNQELYGLPTSLPWALEIEPAYRVAGYEDSATFHPTFLYESLWNLALVGVLLWADRRRVDGRRWLRPGTLGFGYLIGYGVGRFWTELLRIDQPERYFGLSRNNWVALLVIIIGIAGAWWWQHRTAASPTEPDRTPHTEDDPVPDADGARRDDPRTDGPRAGHPDADDADGRDARPGDHGDDG